MLLLRNGGVNYTIYADFKDGQVCFIHWSNLASRRQNMGIILVCALKSQVGQTDSISVTRTY
jgi:hypothetical protein